MLEQGLLNVMLTDATVSQLVGNIFIGFFPHNHCLPAVLIETLDEGFTVDLDGTRKLRNARVAFNCVDFNYVKAATLAEAVLTLFQNYRGLLLDSVSGPGLMVNGTIPMKMRDDPFEEEGRGGEPLNRRIVDIEFWFFPN